METKVSSKEWLAEHMAGLSKLKRLQVCLGMTRYKVLKGTDEWVIERRPYYWNPLLWTLIAVISIVMVVLLIVAWPFVIVESVWKVWKKGMTRQIVNCMAVENIKNQTK